MYGPRYAVLTCLCQRLRPQAELSLHACPTPPSPPPGRRPPALLFFCLATAHDPRGGGVGWGGGRGTADHVGISETCQCRASDAASAPIYRCIMSSPPLCADGPTGQHLVLHPCHPHPQSKDRIDATCQLPGLCPDIPVPLCSSLDSRDAAAACSIWHVQHAAGRCAAGAQRKPAGTSSNSTKRMWSAASMAYTTVTQSIAHGERMRSEGAAIPYNLCWGGDKYPAVCDPYQEATQEEGKTPVTIQ